MPTRSIANPLGAIVAVLVLLWAGLGQATAQSYDDPDGPESSFSELDRYGQWRAHPEWGTVWIPDVDDDWRPYTIGRWVWTEEHGWYWDSEEPFGWAVFHYGRWIYDEQDGWLWIPGTEWGPAWVAWRYSDDAIGWAPLPPDAVWEPDSGLTLSEAFYSSPRYAPFWIFMAPRYMSMPSLHRHVWAPRRNYDAFWRSRPATRYAWSNRRVFNHGVRPGDLERHGARIAPLRIQPSSRPGMGRRDGGVYAYRPNIVTSDRWRAGRSGDWRRFEPSRRDSVRQERGRDRDRGPDAFRREAAPERGRGEDSWRRDSSPDRSRSGDWQGRDRQERRPDRPPQADVRRDGDRDRERDRERSRERPADNPFNVPERRTEPRSDPRFERGRETQSEPRSERRQETRTEPRFERRQEPRGSAPQDEPRVQRREVPREEGRRSSGEASRPFNAPQQRQPQANPPQQREQPPQGRGEQPRQEQPQQRQGGPFQRGGG